MSASPEGVWSNAGSITFEDPADDSEILVAGFRDYSITPGYEHATQYTMDSTFWDAVKRYEHDVSVELTHVKFSIEFVQEWLGGEGSTATASQDSADPMLYNINRVTPSSDGTFERTVAVTDVHFPEMPVDAATYGEFEEYSLTGTGRTIDQLEDTSAV